MDSPHLVIVLALITGFFLIVLLAFQICACVKSFQRVQREKARLEEIRVAAAECPPPYALVVLDRNVLRQPPQSPHQCHVSNGVCNIMTTSQEPASVAERQNYNFDNESATAVPNFPLASSNGPMCTLCCPRQRDPTSGRAPGELSSPTNTPAISSFVRRGNLCEKVQIENEHPPTYAEAIRYSLSETT